MPKRIFKPRTRETKFRDARLIIIAAEGIKTEEKYFHDLAFDERYRNPKVHVQLLEHPPSDSSPDQVIKELDKFRRQYHLNEYDELWLVIDLDRWGNAKLSDISKQCLDKKYLLAVSHPCFEIWLLLHVKSLSEYSAEELEALQQNKKRNDRTQLEIALVEACGSFNKSNLNTAHYLPYVETAIHRAQDLDVKPEDRWPNQLGTRVYLLAQSIIKNSHRNK